MKKRHKYRKNNVNGARPKAQKLLGQTIRYAVWGYPDDRKRLRNCKKKMQSDRNLTCQDAPVSDCFYVVVPWHEDRKSAENKIERQVIVHKLGGCIFVPDGANLSLLVEKAKQQGKEGRTAMVTVKEIFDTEKKKDDYVPISRVDASAVIAVANPVLSEVDAELQVPAAANLGGTDVEEVDSFQLRDGRVITLDIIKGLAEKGNKKEAAQVLRVSAHILHRILDTVSGARDVEFSYFCRLSICPQNGSYFGKGGNGESILKAHSMLYHGVNKTVAATEESVIPAGQNFIEDIPDDHLFAEIVRRENLVESELEIERKRFEEATKQAAEYGAKIQMLTQRRDILRSMRGEAQQEPITKPE